ncbi:hypothetical protein ADJ77_11385 [Prevotella fusca JCM 17724]|uniref:Uncharacterized protein n=1 Tax=Prevotella fusca JCM 17724 TaxID=1236517 RepID=A0A0K1NMP9_9BACT|nr:hypothetical protein ADJ77_11385 [Prevotella fusca JCM 17724]
MSLPDEPMGNREEKKETRTELVRVLKHSQECVEIVPGDKAQERTRHASVNKVRQWTHTSRSPAFTQPQGQLPTS